MEVLDIVKVLFPTVVSFGVGILITPAVTHFLYKHKMWKKKSGKVDMDGTETPIFNALHKDREVNTPRMGGLVIWVSSLITILGFWLFAKVFPFDFFSKLDFLSRDQTWIPLFTLIAGGIVGMIDDVLEIRGNGGRFSGGLSLKKRLGVVTVIGILAASWFFFKLDVIGLGLPNGGIIELGWLFIPVFVAIMLFIYAGGIIDGIDGLAGGVFATTFLAYSSVAFHQDQINLAAFCAMLAGSILAFLWFNIPPARFYMSETGTMGLTLTLAVVAFLTDSLGEGYGVLVLPVIALPLVLTTLSVIIQVLSKRFRKGKKVFLSAPVHHHFEAIGWPPYKVTMRYWIISIIFALLGMVLAFIG
ncbi:MAG: hypothetical protein U1D31_02360 [Patescibacteria group bacterium]|nr:hypothetical protein [bacterium]MDZ4240941.1 hypothetical protein [Patescibacteria group bacterium]